MASPSRQPPLGGSGLLHGSRARSYGSLVQSACSPVRERRLEHQLKPGDTLAGLALKYGVTMEQIKRANRLYTNDSIFLKKTLYIPILTEPKDLFNGLDSEEEKDGEEEVHPSKDEAWPHSAERNKQEMGSERAKGDNVPPTLGQDTPGPTQDLSASDFLKKLDSQISLSKKVAAQKLSRGDSGVPREDARLHLSSPRTQQRAVLGPVPLTRTSRTQTLRDQEDEIFKL
ncbi:lysM and putative peptidoglycan-binding domain-containing protein 1 [Erethizon dorsatum]